MGDRVVVLTVALTVALALPAGAGERTVCPGPRVDCHRVRDRHVARPPFPSLVFTVVDPWEATPPAVVLPDSGPAHAAELDAAIERLGRLIREIEARPAVRR